MRRADALSIGAWWAFGTLLLVVLGLLSGQVPPSPEQRIWLLVIESELLVAQVVIVVLRTRKH